MLRVILRQILRILVTLFIGGLFAATLIRYAPGFDSDEQQMDSRLSNESIQALREARAGERNILKFYAAFLSSAARGDLGLSRSLNRPVKDLVRERTPVTIKLIGTGLLAGWALGLVLAISAAMARVAAYDVFTTALSGLFLCIPSAVLALLFVFANAPGALAIGLVVFAHVFRYWRNLLDKSYAMPHIMMARAKGLGPVRVLLFHVLPVSGGQLLAVAGISVSVALGAAIPVEALCGIPGIGQLAWQAALGRDLSLLVTLTFIVTIITLLANTTSDLLGRSFRAQEA
jgi:peptide/nickel transport system permease protein